MKRIFIVAALALSLAGCGTLQNIQTAFQVGTASIANPVTKDRLNQIESAITLVFAGLQTWKHSCQQGLLPPSCRDQIAQVQVYTRRLPPYLTQLRVFVRTNDQVNAAVVFNSIVDLVGTVKAQAAASGVTVGS